MKSAFAVNNTAQPQSSVFRAPPVGSSSAFAAGTAAPAFSAFQKAAPVGATPTAAPVFAFAKPVAATPPPATAPPTLQTPRQQPQQQQVPRASPGPASVINRGLNNSASVSAPHAAAPENGPRSFSGGAPRPATSTAASPDHSFNSRRGRGGRDAMDRSFPVDSSQAQRSQPPPTNNGNNSFTPFTLPAPRPIFTSPVPAAPLLSSHDGSPRPQPPLLSTPPPLAFASSATPVPQTASPRHVPSHPPVAAADGVGVRLFRLMIDKLWADEWGDVFRLLDLFCTERKYGGDDFASQLAAFVKVASDKVNTNAASGHHGHPSPDAAVRALAEHMCCRAFAAAVCLAAHANATETDAIARSDGVDECLSEAYQGFATSFRMLTDTLQSAVEDSRVVGAAKMKPLGLITPLFDRTRLCVARCRAANVRINPAWLRGACTTLYKTINRAAPFTSSATTRETAIAAARVIGELATGDSLGTLGGYIPFVDHFDALWPKEVDTRAILHFRVGQGLAANLCWEVAAKHFAAALVLFGNVHNASRFAVLEGLVAVKLALGEVPDPSLFVDHAMPELEDIALALRTANIRLFESALAANEAGLMAKGYLAAANSARLFVLQQMIVKFFMARATTDFEVRMTELRAYFAGSLDENLDLGQSCVVPLLLSGRIRGYLSNNVLKLSKKDPFPGLPVDALLPSNQTVPASPALKPAAPLLVGTPGSPLASATLPA